MITFHSETLANILPCVESLAQAHWHEVEEIMHGKQDYTINEHAYKQLEELNMLHISIAKDTQENIGGYIVFIITSSHHKPQELIASLDAFYLVPAMRKSFTAIEFLRNAESSLRERGVHVIQFSSPASRPCDALYKRLGAKHIENIYHKRLI